VKAQPELLPRVVTTNCWLVSHKLAVVVIALVTTNHKMCTAYILHTYWINSTSQ